MKHILIVEDDECIAELQSDYLEVHGFKVTVCFDGFDAMKKIDENEYDLIILDIMLPGLDGFKILKSIREDSFIPLIIVSSKKDEVDKIRGLNLGADDYITKPFSPGELVARVNMHITKYNRLKDKFSIKNNKNLIIRGLEIQPDSRRVFINEKEINMAQKEFELLLFLAQNPNHVYGREEIFDKIWGMDALGDVSTVTVHIARIREKIEIDLSNPQFIETVWGAGYRFRI